MKTVEIKLYKFNELSEDTQKKVIQDWRYDGEYLWIDDDIDILKQFAEDFNITIKDYELSPYSHSYIKYDTSTLDTDIDIHSLESKKDDSYLYGFMLEEYKKQLKYTSDKEYSFNQAMECGKIYIIKEMEYQNSDEYIEESITINEYDFTEDGEIY